MDDAHPERLTEKEFLARYRPEAYARPSVAVDVVLVSVVEGTLRVHGVRRDAHPHRGRFALPGTFLREDERLEVAARRVLREKAGLSRVHLEQLHTFGDPRRDPRMRVISVAYLALLTESGLARRHPSLIDAHLRASFFGTEPGLIALRTPGGDPLPSAFDHDEIIATAVRWLRSRVGEASMAASLLPRDFTLFQLLRLHEAVFGRQLNKDSFRRRMLASAALQATGAQQAGVGHRPAALYRYVAPFGRRHKARSEAQSEAGSGSRGHPVAGGSHPARPDAPERPKRPARIERLEPTPRAKRTRASRS